MGDIHLDAAAAFVGLHPEPPALPPGGRCQVLRGVSFVPPLQPGRSVRMTVSYLGDRYHSDLWKWAHNRGGRLCPRLRRGAEGHPATRRPARRFSHTGRAGLVCAKGRSGCCGPTPQEPSAVCNFFVRRLFSFPPAPQNGNRNRRRRATGGGHLHCPAVTPSCPPPVPCCTRNCPRQQSYLCMGRCAGSCARVRFLAVRRLEPAVPCARCIPAGLRVILRHGRAHDTQPRERFERRR